MSRMRTGGQETGRASGKGGGGLPPVPNPRAHGSCRGRVRRPAAVAHAADPQKLFALDAEQGTLTPVKGKPGVHRLVLEDVRARALYFTDRPVREVGTVALRRMLRALFAGDSSPPNAAVNATASKRGQLLMGVELRSWRYDAPR
jgi:hypothetical protein